MDKNEKYRKWKRTHSGQRAMLKARKQAEAQRQRRVAARKAFIERHLQDQYL
jgi:hypothetical protein